MKVIMGITIPSLALGLLIPIAMYGRSASVDVKRGQPTTRDLRLTASTAQADPVQFQEQQASHGIDTIEGRDELSVDAALLQSYGPSDLPLTADRLSAKTKAANAVKELRQRFTNLNELGEGRSADRAQLSSTDRQVIREKLHEVLASDPDAAVFREARTAGMARLLADRQAFAPQRAATNVEEKVAIAQARAARKTELLPLSLAKPSQADAPANLGRQRDIERLTTAIQAADNVYEQDRLKLVLAAAHVGAGQRREANAIYEELARSAALEGIRQTARRNLSILADRETSSGSPPKDARDPMVPHRNEGGAK